MSAIGVESLEAASSIAIDSVVAAESDAPVPVGPVRMKPGANRSAPTSALQRVDGRGPRAVLALTPPDRVSAAADGLRRELVACGESSTVRVRDECTRPPAGSASINRRSLPPRAGATITGSEDRADDDRALGYSPSTAKRSSRAAPSRPRGTAPVERVSAKRRGLAARGLLAEEPPGGQTLAVARGLVRCGAAWSFRKSSASQEARGRVPPQDPSLSYRRARTSMRPFVTRAS